MEKGRTEAIFDLKNMLSGLRISKLLCVAEATVLKYMKIEYILVINGQVSHITTSFERRFLTATCTATCTAKCTCKVS